MRILKKILFVIVGIIALILIIAAFVKKEYAVERQVIINKSNTEVFEYVKYLKNQDNYSVWGKMDPNIIKSFTGIDGTVGFISAWESDNKEVGKGEQEIVGIEEGKRIEFELRFMEPFEAVEPAYMITEGIDSINTIVKWGFSGKMQYPSNIMLLWMDMEEIIGSDLENGLDNLKTILEK